MNDHQLIDMVINPDHQVIECLIRKVFGGSAISKNIDHMNLTLNVFELHQYLISLLRKMQNTFSEQAVKKIG